MSESLPVVGVEQLQVGMFVSLDLPWLDHPFMVNSFRINSPEQLKTLRELGLSKIAFDPARSTAGPLDPAEAPAPPPIQEVHREDPAQAELKRERVARMREHRERIQSCEQAYGECVGSTKNLIADLLRDPARATAAAGAMVGELSATFFGDPGATVMLVASRKRDDASHQHMLNVMILTMMLAKGLGLNRDVFEAAGMGALLHDIGITRISPAILRNRRRTRPEESLFRLHGEYGLQLVGAHVPPPVRVVIRDHHELLDGSGFPAGKQGKAVNPLARIVAIADRYDTLCNPPSLSDALTPAEAVAQMYAREAARYDPYMLATFIKELGVYPPGSFVRLSTGSIAIVIAVTPGNTLKPTVLVYEPGVPRRDALVLSLAETEDVSIEEIVKPATLSNEIVQYLNPRMNLAYFAHKAVR